MIAIVGAGMTGLALAHELGRRGVEHVVLEAADRPGGVVRSGRVDGHLLDWGPQRTRMVGPVRALVAGLELDAEVVTAPAGLPLFVYREGRLRRVPFSAWEFLRTDLLGVRSKLRVLAEPFTAAPRGGERVADFLTRKLGREAYLHLLGPLYGGLYASDPAEMEMELSLQHVLREFGIGRSLLLPLLRRGGAIDPPPACSFREGMQALPDALYRRHAERVRLASPVRALRRDGPGHRLSLVGGDDVVADEVVITTPPGAAAAMLRSLAPEAADRIGGLTCNPLAVVHLHAGTELRGLGYQVSLAESLATRGVTFNASLFGRSGIYTAYLGGAKRPEVAGWSDERIAGTAVREFREVTGCDARAISVAHERMPAWDVSWRALTGLTLPPGIHLAANWESRPGIPGRLAQAARLAERLAAERPGDRSS
jgi:protoporphyrinogen/coproporphyrinogen III oxidase